MVPAEECWRKTLEPLMAEVRKEMGDKPVYISFDIDGLDPAYAPGTGTPEIAGLTPAQVRGTWLRFPAGRGRFCSRWKRPCRQRGEAKGWGGRGAFRSGDEERTCRTDAIWSV